MKDNYDSLQIIIRGLANDLNNILTIAMGNMSLCELYIDDDRDKLSTIINNSLSTCKRAQELVAQLNLVSNIQSSKIEIISLLDLLKETVSCLETPGRQKLVLINNSKTFNTEGDPEEIKQIFQNLIINSLQAIDESESLKIVLDNIEIESHNRNDMEPGYYVRISFQDNGAGISEENQSKIFKRKFTTKESSSGLGLIITKTLTEKNHAYINFNSEKDKGSTFNVYFRTTPLLITKPDNEPSELFGEQIKSIQNKKILIMDDEEKILSILSDILVNQNIVVDTAIDKDEAVRKYTDSMDTNQPYDLVILDLIIMGEPVGVEVLGALKEIDDACKAVIMSGSTTHRAINKYSDFGFCNYIFKPFNSDKFMKVVYDSIYYN